MCRKFRNLDQFNSRTIPLRRLQRLCRFLASSRFTLALLIACCVIANGLIAEQAIAATKKTTKKKSSSAKKSAPTQEAESAPTPQASEPATTENKAPTSSPSESSGSPTDQVPLTEAEVLKVAPTVRAATPEIDDNPAKGRYTRPLLFAPDDNKIKFTSPQIVWDLSQGNKIYLGGIILESSAIEMVLSQSDRSTVPSRYRISGRGDSKVTILSFRWPTILTNIGTISVETPQGKPLWQMDVTAEAREEWKSHLRYDSNKILKDHTASSFAAFDLDLKTLPWLKEGTQIKYCIRQKNPQSEKLRICSNIFSIMGNNKNLDLESNSAEKTPIVAINGSNIGPRGIVNFPEGKNIEIKITFSNDARIELSSRPLQLKFLDVVISKDGNNLLLTGQGAKPVGKVKNLEVPPNHFWSATGIEKEIIWQVSTPITQPTLRVLGAWNIPFTYLIKYDDVPGEQDRIFINTRTGSGTYVTGARVRAYTSSGGTLVSKEEGVKRGNKNEYTWFFAAPNKGTNNKSRLLLDTGSNLAGQEKKTWVAHYQLYRGYPYEFSSRLTGIVTPALSTVLLAEVSTGAWFESLLGLDSYYLSERRWGIAARYFQAMTALVLAKGATPISQFSVANIDLKYNLFPGIWNRDELFGLIGSVETVNIGGISATLTGFGAYWARTMPKIFDDIFNIFPFFRYPKYVDMEFLYFPTALTAGINPGISYNLNFHGKVFWSKRIYGEAGFGLKQFQYVKIDQAATVQLTTSYGTMGLGIVF